MKQWKKSQTKKKEPKKNLRFLLLSILISGVALSSFIFFTWLVRDVFQVTGTYRSMFYILDGIFVTLLIVLIPVNLKLYRKRKKELDTLLEAIRKVADGKYSFRIAVDEKAGFAPIYEDFNKMCGELESVQLLRNDFINNYSHEFKTPITSINGFASLLLERELSEKEQREYLEIIVEESARLSQLAANTILLSRLNVQQIITDIEEYDLSEQIRQCSVILSKSWLEKGIEFDGEFPSVRFYGNKELMQHLWLNLLNNAVKYTPAGGKITVRVTAQGESIAALISDTGEGMSAETQEHLFEPYYQGDTSHAGQGLGLGLSICRRITELCGGTISVRSEQGKGSCFTVTLPKK